ncbi:hypothetical protein CBM2637_A70281 [Cupriavidus taiwanensis]|nr:hypothetical protein CBM2637_A70281 [Cupriavidus taiwanensis]
MRGRDGALVGAIPASHRRLPDSAMPGRCLDWPCRRKPAQAGMCGIRRAGPRPGRRFRP